MIFCARFLRRYSVAVAVGVAVAVAVRAVTSAISLQYRESALEVEGGA